MFIKNHFTLLNISRLKYKDVLTFLPEVTPKLAKKGAAAVNINGGSFFYIFHIILYCTMYLPPYIKGRLLHLSLRFKREGEGT